MRAVSKRPPQGFENRLATNRDRFHGWRAVGDAHQSNDIEAASAGTGHRARAPQRGDWSGAQHRADPAPILPCPCGAQCEIQFRLAVTHAAEPGERAGADLASLGDASVVTQRRELFGRRTGSGRCRRQLVGLRHHLQLASETVGPSQETGVVRYQVQLGQSLFRRCHVPGGQRRFTSDQQQRRAASFTIVESIEGSAGQRTSRGDVVTLEGPQRCCV